MIYYISDCDWYFFRCTIIFFVLWFSKKKKGKYFVIFQIWLYFKLPRHRPQIEKVSETLFHPASAGRSRKLKGSTCARSVGNCRFPEIGTPGSQRGNCGLRLQGSAVSCFAFWSCTKRFALLMGPVHNAFFCLLARYRMLCFVSWSGTGRFVLLIGPVPDALFLVVGPVHDALFCLLVQ